MNILVLIKPVVESSSTILNADMTLNRRDSHATICMADAHAIEIATSFKSSNFDILTLYPNYPSTTISQLRSYGCRRIYHICSDEFRGSDTYATASALSNAIKYLEKDELYDLIIAGNASTDSETGQVPSSLAYFLDRPIITNVFEVDNNIVKRVLESSTDTITLPNNSIISVTPKGTTLPPPSLFMMRKASKVEYLKITASDIGVHDREFGSTFSKTKVKKVISRIQKWRKAEVTHDARTGALWIMNEFYKKREEGEDTITLNNTSSINLASDVFVIVPTFDKTGFDCSLEIISDLRMRCVYPTCIVIGEDINSEIIEKYGATKIVKILIESTIDDGMYASLLSSYFLNKKGTIFGAASIRMRSIMPQLAASLGAGLAADCIDYEIKNGSFVFKRPVFEGTMEATIAITSDIGMLTIRPGTIKKYLFASIGKVDKKEFKTSYKAPRLKLLAREDEIKESKNNKVMFSIGSGVKEADLRQRIISFNTSMGSSRTAVNSFALPYSWQIGLTGKMVHSDVYVAFAISGQAQHAIALQGAKTVIAVNKDPSAPIFAYSDKAIIADVEEVVKYMEELRRSDDGVQKEL